VRCHFYARTLAPPADPDPDPDPDSDDADGGGGGEQPAAPAAYDYAPLDIAGWHQDTALHTQIPPVVGDLVWLVNEYTRTGATYRVTERHWNYPAYGSQRWPAASTQADNCDMTLIVEPAPGPFRTGPEDR
jgi:hypothetical protein